MCKVNIAAFGRRILPQTWLRECLVEDLRLWDIAVKPAVTICVEQKITAVVLYEA
jgi:hypothetical protein